MKQHVFGFALLLASMALVSTGCKFWSLGSPPDEPVAQQSVATPQTVSAPVVAGPVNLDTDPHLVGWWKLDDTTGKAVSDSSGKGHNGAIDGGASFDANSAPGRSGKALRLDDGEAITITGYKGVLGPSPRTITAWVKTDQARGMIMSWGMDEGGKQWNFRIMGRGIWADPKGGYLYTDEIIHDDQWHHVAVVVRQAEGEPTLLNDVTLYRDGVVQEIHDIGLLHMYAINTEAGRDVQIGAGFKGLIDDVRLYDRALSESEIAALANLKNTVSE